jgi:hypothetical protein
MGETDRSFRKYDGVGDWVARVGIPAAIAFILLWQTNAKLDRIDSKLERLCAQTELREVRK